MNPVRLIAILLGLAFVAILVGVTVLSVMPAGSLIGGERTALIAAIVIAIGMASWITEPA